MRLSSTKRKPLSTSKLLAKTTSKSRRSHYQTFQKKKRSRTNFETYPPIQLGIGI